VEKHLRSRYQWSAGGVDGTLLPDGMHEDVLEEEVVATKEPGMEAGILLSGLIAHYSSPAAVGWDMILETLGKEKWADGL